MTFSVVARHPFLSTADQDAAMKCKNQPVYWVSDEHIHTLGPNTYIPLHRTPRDVHVAPHHDAMMTSP